MPIVGINPVSRQPKKDTWDKIAQGIKIATSVLGTGIAIPKALQEMRLGKEAEARQQELLNLEKTKTDIDVATKTRPAKEIGRPEVREIPGGGIVSAIRPTFEEGATEVSGYGMRVPIGESSNLLKSLNIDRLMTQNRTISDEEAVALADFTKKPVTLFKGKQANDPIIARLVTASQGQQRIGIAEEGLGERISQNLRGFKDATISKFESDPIVIKATEGREAAERIIVLSDFSDKNPIAASAIPTFMARASGEVGNLSEADKRPFGGSQALVARINQAFEKWKSGTLTPENIAFVKELATLMVAHGNSVRRRRANEVAIQRASIRKDIDKDDVLDMLGFGRESSGNSPPGGGSFSDLSDEDLLKRLVE